MFDVLLQAAVFCQNAVEEASHEAKTIQTSVVPHDIRCMHKLVRNKYAYIKMER